MGAGFQYRDITWVNYADAIDNVSVGLVQTRYLDCIAKADVLQSAKEPISVTGNRNVAFFPGIGRTCNVPDSPVQAQAVGSFQNGYFDPNFGYAQNADR